MLQKIQRKMEELNMVAPGDVVLAGVSGGADSVCLLMLLKELTQVMDFSIEAVHVEHGIRGTESLQDEQFVVELCARLDVPLTCIKVDVPRYVEQLGMSVEEAARKLRYEAFAQLAGKKNAKVALAHHMEDNAETILFQMLRGSSLNGLCGMQPVRYDEDGIAYIRPLLHVHREEIEEWLLQRGQNYCIDSTNAELEYSRNYWRNRVLPQLGQINEQAVEHINGTAGRLRDIWDYLEQETDKAWTKVCMLLERDYVVLKLDALCALHVALQKEIVLKAIAVVNGSRKDITAVHVTDVLELCHKQSGRMVSLSYGIEAKREFDTLRIYKVEDDSKKSQAETWEHIVDEEALEAHFQSKEPLELMLGESEERLVLKVFSYDGKSAKIPKKPYTKWFDYDKIKQGFCIRNRKQGDYFISDTAGHHKKLKQYMIEEKIPVDMRGQLWLLAQDSLVLWLVGGRISEHMKVTEDTKIVIEIEYQGGNQNGFYTEA